MIPYDGKRWITVLFRLHGSIAPRLVGRVLLCALIGVAAAWLQIHRGFHLSLVAHSLLGIVLGLLLVFRTNSSYDRFWEGRRLLGMVVNRCRDLARQVASYIEGDDAAARADRRELTRGVVILYALLRQYLRKERDLDQLGVPLTDDERAALEPVAVRPVVAFTWLSRRMAAAARAGRLTEYRLMLMDGNLTSLADSWGGAERILKTPIPFAYAQHIKWFLVLFTFSLPFALADAMRWYTPGAAAVLAFALFGVDEIGVEIEDPFGYDPNDLPLDDIGKVVAADLTAIQAVRSEEAAAA